MKTTVRWRDVSDEERETVFEGLDPKAVGARRRFAVYLAERAYDDSGSEDYREGGELEILSPPEIAGKYVITTDYEPVFTVHLVQGEEKG
jgi:hypothetical protein